VPVAVNCCLNPAATDAELGVTAMETRDGAVPVPDKVAACGLEVALSTTESVPLRVPKTLGVKTIEIMQVAPAGRVVGLAGQVLVAA
jgi:hypothetical protein